MDFSHSGSAFLAPEATPSDDIPLNQICTDEDCNLAYIHSHTGARSAKESKKSRLEIGKSFVFAIFILNFIVCFWVYVGILIVRFLHIFNIDVQFHLPFHLPIPFVQ
jgi:hypothetical protein